MNARNGYRILIVEDEAKLAHAIDEGLTAEGYATRVCTTGEDAVEVMKTPAADLVVLDVMLPGIDGFTVLRSLRAQGLRLPVLLLTSRDAVEDRVNGLDAGADDYLVKPFAFAELSARLRALARRNAPEMQQTFNLDGLSLDTTRNEVFRDGQRIELTRREFQLLHYLFIHQGGIVSREMLARDVWQETDRYTPLDNVIDVQMTRLRRKVDDGYPHKLLQTVRGVGFTLKDEV